MFSEKKKSAQPEFWIAADRVVTSAQAGFYGKLEDTLESFGFAAKVRALCQPAYDKRSSIGTTSNVWLLNRALIPKMRRRCGGLTVIVLAKGAIKNGRTRTIRTPKLAGPKMGPPT